MIINIYCRLKPTQVILLYFYVCLFNWYKYVFLLHSHETNGFVWVIHEGLKNVWNFFYFVKITQVIERFNSNPNVKDNLIKVLILNSFLRLQSFFFLQRRRRPSWYGNKTVVPHLCNSVPLGSECEMRSRSRNKTNKKHNIEREKEQCLHMQRLICHYRGR